ncbi:hypothetical protein [Amycolatopsis nivea]|uniref:hypothetical protein n=1 Tax=Amycolatopsis nivea TaxID=1644109 RepID=UPI0010704976|nr:hypothetical protein [Amycolatopsis nivea]
MIVRPSEIESLRAAILGTNLVRIEFDRLWRLWNDAAPRFTGDPDQAAALHHALRELSDSVVLELPKQAWDRSTVPALPRHVLVPAARRAANGRAWMTFPWCRQLGWVSSLLTLPPALFEDLIALNDWFGRVVQEGLPVVPVRYRSGEIFGREKRLDELERTTLFGPGRLNLAMLACRRLAPPAPAAAVGTGPDVLVVENSDAYWVAVEELRGSAEHGIGAVVWGSGKTFPAQVPSLAVDVAGQGPLRGIAWYWGDYDPIGTATAVAAARATDGIEVRPATGLWAEMARIPVQEAGTLDWSAAVGEEWLGSEVWAQLSYVRAAGGRIAQELVPVEAVVAWVAGLSASARG